MEIFVNDLTTPSNDNTLFTYGFATYNMTAWREGEEDAINFYEAVTCKDLLPTMYSQEEADRMLKEIWFGGYSDNYLCPNVTSYKVLN